MAGTTKGAKRAWKTMKRNQKNQETAKGLLENCKRSTKVEIMQADNAKIIVIKD